MDKTFDNAALIKEYIVTNRQDFNNMLLSEAVNVRQKIEEILLIGNIDLLNNAQKLVIYVIDQQKKEVIDFAKQEGIAWAAHSLTLNFKLEWVQAIRRTMWAFINQFVQQSKESFNREEFFVMEKQINNQIDSFLNTFFISYSNYKDILIEKQTKMVENLSVPIIPITPTICILPLIGIWDDNRSKIIEKKALKAVGEHHIQTLIIDLSGIAEMDPDVIDQLMKLIEGTSMMGCESIITGLRPDIVQQIIHMGINFENKATTMGSLQQAIKRFL
jgi:rsbT co-antagonist protein RsbR